MPNIERVCVEPDCGEKYVITERDQEFYNSMKGDGGKPYVFPKRCKECRQKRKAQKEDKHFVQGNEVHFHR